MVVHACSLFNLIDYDDDDDGGDDPLIHLNNRIYKYEHIND